MANRIPNGIDTGTIVIVRPGDYFILALPDGTLLNVDQTADGFTIRRQNGVVAYTKATNTNDGEDLS